MRTPLSIAGGYVDLLRQQALPAETLDDLQVVREEVDRSSRAVDRLLRLIHSQENLPMLDVDLDELLHQIMDRWRVVADRDWCIDSSVGTRKANADRVRACIDTLIENAVRYTASGDVVRVFGGVEADGFVIGVADSGPGFTPSQMSAINLPGNAPTEVALLNDPRSQTGLGLSLVRDVVESRGGRLVVRHSAQGGAEVRLEWPRKLVDVPRSATASATA
jgi:signal transduction histidine kinase